MSFLASKIIELFDISRYFKVLIRFSKIFPIILCLILYVCFVDRCLFLLYVFFWPLCCQFVFDIRIMITPLVSSNSSYETYSINVLFICSIDPHRNLNIIWFLIKYHMFCKNLRKNISPISSYFFICCLPTTVFFFFLAIPHILVFVYDNSGTRKGMHLQIHTCI